MKFIYVKDWVYHKDSINVGYYNYNYNDCYLDTSKGLAQYLSGSSCSISIWMNMWTDELIIHQCLKYVVWQSKLSFR